MDGKKLEGWIGYIKANFWPEDPIRSYLSAKADGEDFGFDSEAEFQVALSTVHGEIANLLGISRTEVAIRIALADGNESGSLLIRWGEGDQTALLVDRSRRLGYLVGDHADGFGNRAPQFSEDEKAQMLAEWEAEGPTDYQHLLGKMKKTLFINGSYHETFAFAAMEISADVIPTITDR